MNNRKRQCQPAVIALLIIDIITVLWDFSAISKIV